MNKKLRELLDEINGLKTQVINLTEQGKIEEAKQAKQELQDKQAAFDLMKDVMDPNGDGTVEPEGKPLEDKKDAIHEFAQAARRGFRNMNNEGTPADGGYTVPEDIQTRINKFREANFSLQSLVSTESVGTMSGRRTYQTRSNHTGFAKVAEAGKIGAKNGPTFTPVNYTIEKYAGYLPVTNELLEDSDANISQVLIDWLGEEDVATRNALVLAAIATKTAVDLTPVTGEGALDKIKKALNVTLGQAFAATSAIVTNDDGLNYLDTLRDQNGRYLLQPDINPDNPFSMTLAIGARRVPVVVVPNGVMATTSTQADNQTTNQIPFVIGDLKEYCRIFDRKQLTISVSDVAAVGTGAAAINAFEEDLTIFRGIMRLDAEVVDSAAIVNGYITVSGN
jgi:HK97 family phage major capsid protein